MKFNIVILLIICVGIITSCDAVPYRHQVTCDSGFETPVSKWARAEDGVVIWQVGKSTPRYSRKMNQGEICTEIARF